MKNDPINQSEPHDALPLLKDGGPVPERCPECMAPLPVGSETVDEVTEIINSSSIVAITWQNVAGWPVTYITENAERVIGYKPSDLLSGRARYDQIIHPDDLERVTREVAFYSGQAGCKNFVHKPYRILSPTGEFRWIEDRTYLHRNASGEITHYRGILYDVTDRIQLEQALRQSEERLAMALSGANEGIWDWDLISDNVYFDSGYYRMAGYEPYEFPANLAEWESRVHKDDLARVKSTLLGYLAGELDSYEVEFRFLCRDGSYMWILAKGKKVDWDSEGKQTRFVGTHTDITQRKRIEEALVESEARLNEAQKLAGLGYWEWDIKTGKVTWSEEVFKIFHLDPATFTPQIDSIMQLSPWPEYRNRHEELIQRTVERKEKGSYDQKFLRPDGSIGYYASSFKGGYNDNGDLISMHGTVMDITERKIQESELKRLRNYLGNIIDSMPSIIVTVDNSFNITQWNSKAEQATGLSFEEAKSQPLDTVFPRFSTEMHRIRKSIEERRVVTVPRIMQVSAKDTRYDAITIYPLVAEGEDGAVIRVDDVTEQVHMEEMMIQNEKMLSVGGLAAGMAHEINNPLAGIMQTASVMRARLQDTEMPANITAADAVGVSLHKIKSFLERRNIFRMLDTIDKSAKWMASIVDNMLNFARKSNAGVAMYAIEDLLDKTVELAATEYDLQKHYDFKKIEVKREYAKEQCIVPCEGAAIQQVLFNILRNGSQAMLEAQTPSPRFIFRTRTDTAKNRVILEIEDNGPGMDATVRTRIFEPFFTTKPAGDGTGLGLSVSYFIITENHHGSLTVESTKGAGAKFIIQLPLNPALQPATTAHPT